MTGRKPRRRTILRASGAVIAGLGALGTATASGVESDTGMAGASSEFRQIPRQGLSDAQLQTETVTAATPERASGIRPGSQMFIHFPDGTTAGCTANFIWRDAGGAGSQGSPANGSPDASNGNAGAADDRNASGGGDGSLYIGAAGHCFLPSDVNASKNAKRKEEDEDDVYDVSQLTVEVCTECTFGGATGFFVVSGETIELGEVVYARQALPDGSQVGHDFGIVEIPAELTDAVNPSLPQWGGPTGVSNDAVPQGEPVHQYGAGVGNGEVYPTMGSSGVSQGDRGSSESWVATIRASPGDSGSPLVSSTAPTTVPAGEDAAGILTHLVLSSDPFGNGTAGTTIGRCKELVSEDIDLDLAVKLA